MFSGQNALLQEPRTSGSGGDSGTDSHLEKLTGVLEVSLRKVLEQVHPRLTATDDAVSHIENLCLRLLMMLCNNSPKTIQDVEDRVKKTFPNPIDKWALSEARETVDKSKKKKLVLPHDKIHQILQKDVLQHKIDSSVTLFLVAILEYISADVFKLAGNYVRNIKHDEISREDIQLSMCADKVLMDMFDQGEGGDTHSLSPSPLPPTPRDSLTYEEIVKELISVEKQYQRELHMIIQVFREELLKIVEEPHQLDPIFSNINDIYDLTVTLIGSLEDVIEMAQEQSPPCVGSCFEELAEAQEFEVYIKYARDVTSETARNALSELLAKPAANSLSTAGHGFRIAVKYYLPKLLLGPISHAFLYFDYIKDLLQTSPTQEDRESFEQVPGVLKPLQMELQTIAASIPKETLQRQNSRQRKQNAMEKLKELEKTVEHWNKDVGQNCNEFIREDVLEIQTSSKRVTYRKAFLFDGLLILCKQIRNRQRTVTGNAPTYDYRLKERFHMRRVEIIDRADTDELRHAFEISPRDLNSVVLIAKNAAHKSDWMADLIMLNTKSMLERLLDSILLEIEKKHPLRLPPPEMYKFAEPDGAHNIVHENSSIVLIKGATLVKLVERLTYHVYADPTFLRTFLMTYRSFCSPQELLTLLIERFNIPEPHTFVDIFTGGGIGSSSSSGSGVVGATGATGSITSQCMSMSLTDDTEKLHRYLQREDWKKYKKEYVQPVQFRVLNVLRHWVDHHYYDFEQDPNLLQTLLEFLETCKGRPMRKWVEKMVSRIKQKRESDQCEDNHRPITFAFGHSPPPIEKYLDVPDNEMNLLTMHPLELARQLTLLEFEMYKNVKTTELVGAAWTTKDKEEKSPNLMRIIKHTTNFTRWIEKSIVEAQNFEERVAILSRAIEVMMVLLDLNNFNGVISICAAINSASVWRLEHTMTALPKKYKEFISECCELDKKHFKKYQEKLRSINPPCVPFFGMYLTNILHLKEGNPDFLVNNEKLINFAKRRRVAEIIGEIQQYQNQPYCLTPDPKIRHFLENLQPFKDMSVSDISTDMFEKSEKIEVKNSKAPVKFPRRWPELSLKSPGIKPKNRVQGQPSSSKSLMSLQSTLPFVPRPATTGFSSASSATSASSSTAAAAAAAGMSTNNNSDPNNAEHSPPSSSAHEFSVFANVQISGSSNNNSFLSHSNMSLNTISPSAVNSDSISLSPASTSTAAPEIPRRSNSVVSIPSYDIFKPVLSPRNIESVRYMAGSVSRHTLDSLNEEGFASSFTGTIKSPRTTGKSSPQDSEFGSSITLVPSSPKHPAPPPPVLDHMSDVGAIPISPHENVPHQPFSSHNPPPLPPRAIPRRVEKTNASHIQQAPDAPMLPPRDKSPPPLPPRSYISSRHHSPHQSPYGLENSPRGPGLPPVLPCKENVAFIHHTHFGEQCLKLPNTSTIMKRRNSAMERNARDTMSSSSSNLTTTTASSATAINNSSHSPPPPPIGHRRQSSSTSPRYSPGDPLATPQTTTPRLPPKPKTSILSTPDRTTMFPYPNSN